MHSPDNMIGFSLRTRDATIEGFPKHRLLRIPIEGSYLSILSWGKEKVNQNPEYFIKDTGTIIVEPPLSRSRVEFTLPPGMISCGSTRH